MENFDRDRDNADALLAERKDRASEWAGSNKPLFRRRGSAPFNRKPAKVLGKTISAVTFHLRLTCGHEADMYGPPGMDPMTCGREVLCHECYHDALRKADDMALHLSQEDAE